MTILTLVRNFVPAHEQIMAGGWNVGDVARNTFDLEGKVGEDGRENKHV